MPIHIIPLHDDFLSQAKDLLKDHPDIFSEKDTSKFKEDLHTYLALRRHLTEQEFIFIIEENKALYGLIMCQNDPYAHSTYNIKWLVTKKDQQGKGYGTHLMHKAIKKIREVGGKHVYLETSAEKHNKHAQKFYEDLGFKKVGILPDYYDPPIKFPRKLEDGIIYHKAI